MPFPRRSGILEVLDKALVLERELTTEFVQVMEVDIVWVREIDIVPLKEVDIVPGLRLVGWPRV